MEKKVRMADIAQRLGISVVSVSKALSDKEGVSDQMREKIKSVAREMGYVPLRKKAGVENPETSRNIGILVSDKFFAVNKFYAGMYRQISLRCNTYGFSAMLEIVSTEAERSGTMPAMMQSGKVDGLIFLGQLRSEYLTEVTRGGIPYVLLDFYDEELDAISVTSDNVAGGFRLTQHLIRTGRTQIGFVGSVKATSSIMDRFLGYTKALMKAGIPMRQDWILEDRDALGTLKPIVLPQQMPQAFLCSCDEVAHDLVQQLKLMGFRVPEDVAVAGYDDYRLPVITTPQLTTYRVNVEQMGWIAVDQLMQIISGRSVLNGNIVVNGTLVRREST